MLKGNNKMVLNGATMNAAVEEYLNKRIIGGGLVVTRVIPGQGKEFTIHVHPEEKPLTEEDAPS